MTDDPIRWTLYDNADFQGLNEDIHDLHLALDAIHNRYAHGWGIVGGLDISGVGSDTLLITPGVALDSGGQTIVLAAHGLGEIGISPPAQSHQLSVPVHLKTSNWPQTTNATLYLTLQYLTYREEANVGPQAKAIQTPWMRLQPAINAAGQVINALVNLGDGSELVLAIVATDASGIITSLKASDPALPYGRRIVGQHVGALSFHAPASTGNPLTVGAATHGTLAPGATGGLEIRAESLTVRDKAEPASPALTSTASGLEITTGSLTVRNRDQPTSATLRFGPEASAAVLRIENNAPQSSSVLDLSSATQHWQLRVDGTDGQKFKLSDATHGINVLTIDQIGNVGIGTTTPRGFQIVVPETSRGGPTPTPGVTIAGGADGNASIELRNKDPQGSPFIDFALTTNDYDARIRLTAPGKLAIEGANLGIGTTNPGARLHVHGGRLRVSESDGATGSGVLEIANSTHANYLFTDGVTGHFHARTDSPNHHLMLQSGGAQGQVGVGTDDPKIKLHVKANGSILALEGTDHAYIEYYPDGFVNGSKAWLGFGDANDNNFSITNQIRGAHIRLNPSSGNVILNGDVSIWDRHALRGSDTWLRLNQEGAFASGVQTPGLFASNALNVGGASRWGDPGPGNVWVTGTVGIGTTAPGKHLHIQGSSSAPFVADGNDRPGLAITGNYPELDLFSGVNNGAHGPTIRLGSYNDDAKQGFKQWVIGTAGRNARFLDIGFNNANDPNPHAGIRNYVGTTMLTLLENGKVGIGTLEPVSQLDVNGDLAIQGKHAFRGSDGWLRLNQDGAFPAGTHTPGFLNAQSMTVGPLYTNPGAGNLQISGRLFVNGDVAIQGKHAFRGSDSWLRLNQDGAFPSGTHTPGFLNAQSMTVGPLYTNPGAGNLLVGGDLGIAGALKWGGDHAEDGYIRIGKMQICWGGGDHVSPFKQHESQQLVNFAQAFRVNPTVTLSINDPGYGVFGLQGGAGVYALTTSGFNLLYKYNYDAGHTIHFSWIAIGLW